MMNEIQKQLDGIVDSYYNELMSTDITNVKEHKFSEKYKQRQNKMNRRSYTIWLEI